MRKPLLSITIPTKNRYSTLFPLIETILDFGLNEELEIVVQDNSDNNKEALDFFYCKKNFNNLHYYYESDTLSVVENSDKAIKNSTGKYICYIGDDDGIMPNIIEVVKWMEMNEIHALRSVNPQYYWPGQRSSFLSKKNTGVLKVPRKKTESFNIKSTQKALDEALSIAGVRILGLPCVYQGIVSRESLNKIYEKTGSFFPGPSPDMANAIALTKVIGSFGFANFPVIIDGKSVNSAGGAGVVHKHLAKIEDVKHLPLDTDRLWSEKIPKYWTGPTIWCESMVVALRKMGYYEDIERIDYGYLYAYLYVFNKKHIKQIFRNFPFYKGWHFYKNIFSIFTYRAITFIRNYLGLAFTKQYDVESIKKAITTLSDKK